METALLSTKLFIPSPRPGLVNRPRLLEQLNSVLTNPFTLISAPAGFGKTTLLIQWISSREPPVPVAWVSLEETENDPVRFWDYVLAAIERVQPSVGETTALMLHAQQPYPIESVLTALINDLRGPADFVLALDDYHAIRSDAIDKGLTFLIEHLPAYAHLMIATRLDPALPLARFRGKGLMLEIGTDDLRFTSDEAGLFCKGAVEPGFSPERSEAINARAEGWITGLKMATLLLRGKRDVQGFIESFAGNQRYVMDYLLEEVLNQQSAEVREFLLKSSILERLEGSLCDAVVGCEGGQEMLRRLEQANLFMVPLDAEGRWYRYHHLFSELLTHELKRTAGPQEIDALHQRASRWYEDHSLLEDAIGHCLKHRDWENATRIVEKAADGLIERGEWNTLYTWFQKMPQESVRTQPRVYFQYANVLLTRGQIDDAEKVLGDLEATLEAGVGFQGDLAFFRMIAAYRRGQYARAGGFGRKALEMLPPDRHGDRARITMVLGGMEMMRGALASAEALLRQGFELAHRDTDMWIKASAAGNLTFILWLRGRLRQALDIADEAIDLAGLSPGSATPR